MKNIYALQPWKVGSRNGKTFVVSIPSNIVKRYNINTSTIFLLKSNEKEGIITIQNQHEVNDNLTKTGRQDGHKNIDCGGIS